MKESGVRDRILEVASRLFFEQGYNLTGINQIIDEASIAKASLYHHFPSKSDLLAAYLQKAETQWFAELNTFLAGVEGPKERLLAIFDFRMERQMRLNYQGCQFIKISNEVLKNESKIFDIATLAKSRMKGYVTDLVSQLKPGPQILSQDLLAETIFLLMEGALVTAVINKNPQPLIDAKKIAAKLL